MVFAAKSFLLSLAAVLAVTLGLPSGAASGQPLPIIDAHGHLNGDMTAERLVALMDRAGVKAMVLMARYYGGERAGGNGTDEQALDFARRFPGRFIPFVAGQRGDLLPRSAWMEGSDRSEAFLRRANEKLKSGGFHGLGEFILRHYDYSNFGTQGGGEVDLPLDSFLMHRIAKIGAAYRLPVLFHAEAEPDVVAGAVRLLQGEAGTPFIWAHNCGRNGAAEIRRLLARHANLMCDLGGMSAPGKAGYGTMWPRRTPWIHLIEDGQGNLLPDVAALFEEFPERFMVGTDAAHTPALQGYVPRIARFRRLLSQLKPETAAKLAYRNAERVFGLTR